MPDEREVAIELAVQRLQESQGFAERTIEQLSEQLLTLSRQLEAASRRIASLEDRVGKLRLSNLSQAQGDDAPEEAP